MKMIYGFLADETAQDLIEYTILMSFVALSSIALFNMAGRSLKGAWTVANNDLTQANTSAS
jgi:Flp pilus assembly pilin Flp